MTKIHLLHFVCEFDDGHEDTSLLGIFSSKDQAEIEMRTLQKNPLLSSYLVLSEGELDRLSWVEGFTTIP